MLIGDRCIQSTQVRLTKSSAAPYSHYTQITGAAKILNDQSNIDQNGLSNISFDSVWSLASFRPSQK